MGGQQPAVADHRRLGPVAKARATSALVDLRQLEFAPSGNFRHVREFDAERLGRIDTDGGGEAAIRVGIERRGGGAVDDEDVFARLDAERLRPLDLGRVADVDVGIDHDDPLQVEVGTLVLALSRRLARPPTWRWSCSRPRSTSKPSTCHNAIEGNLHQTIWYRNAM